MKTLKSLGLVVFYAGLGTALVLGICGIPSLTRGRAITQTSLNELDRKARPYFEEAERNVPRVVSELGGTKAFLNLCGLAVIDKITGSNKAERKIAAAIETPILAPCRKGAAVYRCGINGNLAQGNLADVHSSAMTSALYASGGLALEAIFLRPTMKAFQRIIGPIIGKIAAKVGAGATCAAADGPLPIGDIVGVILAVGGSAWSVHDLLVLRKDFPKAISDALNQAIQEYWRQCRLEAAR